MSGRLVVCPTPIGNLEDVTLRVLAALREADLIACEDTRHTRVLLERYGVSAKLVSYHEHNERARAAELVEQMREGAVVALVSDAATRRGDSNATSVSGPPNVACNSPFLRGRKPTNRHRSAGSALATSAASAADGPGSTSTASPAATHAC
ncbi:MAG TPA: SAM-dependent methyltransferase, partial [Solirubrobacteraceae bacterium]|nr:SAM-dependent methyltransferase [Solirubrobacteraceae bacterium]